MKKYLVLIYGLLLLAECPAQNGVSEFTEPHFGIEAPKKKAEVFMDGMISTLDGKQMCGGFSEKGKEFYFNEIFKGEWTIFQTNLENGNWTNPVPINFTASYTDRDFTLSPDGNSQTCSW